MPRSPLDRGIDDASSPEEVVVVPWMPDANMLWLDLYHICEMLGLLAGDNEIPDEQDCETAT